MVLFLLSLVLFISLYFPIVIATTMNSGGNLYTEQQNQNDIILRLIVGIVSTIPSIVGVAFGFKRYKNGSISNTVGLVLSLLFLTFAVPIMISNIKAL